MADGSGPPKPRYHNYNAVLPTGNATFVSPQPALTEGPSFEARYKAASINGGRSGLSAALKAARTGTPQAEPYSASTPVETAVALNTTTPAAAPAVSPDTKSVPGGGGFFGKA